MSRLLVSVLVAATLLCGGCGLVPDEPGEDGDVGVWSLADPAAVTRSSTVLSIEVTRLACSSGRTGRVPRPGVAYEPTRIVIGTDVEPFTGAARCPGNDAVPVRVQLAEPVGDRDLVDAACLDGQAMTTSLCADPTRWRRR